MNPDQLVRSSKFLSLHLRHRPEQLGITLEPGGWVGVDKLLRAAARQGMAITRAELDEIVAGNDKQRFSFDRTGMRIRANQGHSVEVDLQLPPAEPPAVLYHGTGERSVAAIKRSGLSRMQRRFVHLSGDVQTARLVGARHGRPVVFEVDAASMRADGHCFFQSDNGVWLVDTVPERYLRRYVDASGGARRFLHLGSYGGRLRRPEPRTRPPAPARDQEAAPPSRESRRPRSDQST